MDIDHFVKGIEFYLVKMKNGKWRWRCKWWIDVLAKRRKGKTIWKDKWLQSICKRAGKKKFLKNQNWEERNFWMGQVVILSLNFIFQNLSAQHKISPTIYHSKGV